MNLSNKMVDIFTWNLFNTNKLYKFLELFNILWVVTLIFCNE